MTLVHDAAVGEVVVWHGPHFTRPDRSARVNLDGCIPILRPLAQPDGWVLFERPEDRLSRRSLLLAAACSRASARRGGRSSLACAHRVEVATLPLCWRRRAAGADVVTSQGGDGHGRCAGGWTGSAVRTEP